MRQTKQTRIKGQTIMCTQMAVTEAYKMTPKVGRLLASVLAGLNGVKLENITEMELHEVGVPLMKLFSELENLDSDAFLLELLKGTTVVRSDGDGVKFELYDLEQVNLAFDGDLPALFQAVWFSVKVNFIDFFAADLQKLAGLQVAAEKANPSDSPKN